MLDGVGHAHAVGAHLVYIDRAFAFSTIIVTLAITAMAGTLAVGTVWCNALPHARFTARGRAKPSWTPGIAKKRLLDLVRAKKTGPEVARAPRRAAIPPQAARGDLGSRGRGAHAACRPQPRAVAPRAAHHGPLPALPRLAAKVIAASATRGAAPPPDLRTRQITFFLRSIVCHPAARAGRRSEAHGARQSERSAVLCCSRPGSAALQRARCCACRARARRRNTRMRV